MVGRGVTGEPCGVAALAHGSPLRGAGFAGHFHSANGGGSAPGAGAVTGDHDETFVHRLEVGLVDVQLRPDAVGVGGDDFVVEALHLLDQAGLVEAALGRNHAHGRGHLQRSDEDVSLPDAHVGDVALQDVAVVDAQHVFVGRNVARRLGTERDPGALAESQGIGPIDDRCGADFQPDLVEPGVARLGERLGEGQTAGVPGAVVAEIEIPDLQTARTTHLCVGRIEAGLQGGEADEGFECRPRRIGRAEGAGIKRHGGVVVQLGECVRLDHRDKGVRIERRARGHSENFSVVGIDHDNGAAPSGLGEGFLAGLLYGEVECGYDIVAGDRILHHPFGRPLSFRIECEVEDARGATQLAVEALLQSLAPLGIGEEEVAVLDRFDRQGCDASGVAYDVRGHVSERVMPEVGGLQHEAGAESAAHLGHILAAQILREDQGKHAAVVVVLDDRFIGDIERPRQQILSGEDLTAGEIDRLPVGEFERGGKTQAEIVAHACLGQRRAVAVGDLSARGGHIEQIGARLLLGLPCGTRHLDHIGQSPLGVTCCGKGQQENEEKRHGGVAGEGSMNTHRLTVASHGRSDRGTVMCGGLR